ncbi:MAG: NAD(P)H-dependent oxidoreductase subunit E [Isosphaeraceae bacterium]|nr:NAD(P)H-dependent oxidoreductase subunit E [Isosphaeraceae bacterium]
MAADTTAVIPTPMLTPELRAKIEAYIPRYPSKRAVTLPALHIVHEHYRCVPYQAMAEIAELLGITPAEVHDTMSFYGFFPQAPIGDVRVWFCRSISCMLRGGEEMLHHACQRLGVTSGQTTKDGKITVEFAECLGICDFAPAALADDGRIFGPLTKEAVAQMLDELLRGPVAEAPITPTIGGREREGTAGSPAIAGRDTKI